MAQITTPEDFLTGRKLRAIEALLSSDTVDSACKVVGINRTTMYRYLREPVFDKALKKAKRQMVNRAILRLQQACGDAARALAEVCRDKKAPPQARVSAAREILNNTLKAIEFEDIETRIQALEEKAYEGEFKK